MKKKAKTAWKQFRSKFFPSRLVYIEGTEKERRLKNHSVGIYAAGLVIILAVVAGLLFFNSPHKVEVRSVYKKVANQLGSKNSRMIWGEAKAEDDLSKMEAGYFNDKEYASALSRHIEKIDISKDGNGICVEFKSWVKDSNRQRMQNAFLNFYKEDSDLFVFINTNYTQD